MAEKIDTNRNPKTGRWVKGNTATPLNKVGNKQGNKSFTNLFKEAVKKLGAEPKIISKIGDIKKNPNSLEREIIIKGILEALKGNFPFFKDIMDRLYGKPIQPIQPMEMIQIDIAIQSAINKIYGDKKS